MAQNGESATQNQEVNMPRNFLRQKMLATKQVLNHPVTMCCLDFFKVKPMMEIKSPPLECPPLPVVQSYLDDFDESPPYERSKPQGNQQAEMEFL